MFVIEQFLYGVELTRKIANYKIKFLELWLKVYRNYF